METYTKEIKFVYLGNELTADVYIREWEDGTTEILCINYVLNSNGEEVWHVNMYEKIEEVVKGNTVFN